MGYLKENLPLKPTPEELARRVGRELEKIEEEFTLTFPNPMPILHVEPEKKLQDVIFFAFADGTDWNPGSGRGLYYYDPGLGVPAWVFVA